MNNKRTKIDQLKIIMLAFSEIISIFDTCDLEELLEMEKELDVLETLHENCAFTISLVSKTKVLINKNNQFNKDLFELKEAVKRTVDEYRINNIF